MPCFVKHRDETMASLTFVPSTVPGTAGARALTASGVRSYIRIGIFYAFAEGKWFMHRRYFTTFETSRFLGISLPTVVNWIKAERLKAHRTPGGHRRIAREELASFIRRHGMPMPPELEGEGEAARVMVLHDDDAQAKAIAGLIIRAGFEGVAVSDPFAAGLRIGLERPDLVVIDLSMRADAMELAAELRRHPETSRLALLAVTAPREERSKKAMTLFNAVLPRPLDLETLKRKVETALRGRRAT